MMNEQERISLIRKIVANARAIVSYQVGLPVGCIKMDRLFSWYERYEVLNYPVFRDYCNATQTLPTGSDRLHWNRQALRVRDESLVAINLKFRDTVVDTCFEIIERYGKIEAGNSNTHNI